MKSPPNVHYNVSLHKDKICYKFFNTKSKHIFTLSNNMKTNNFLDSGRRLKKNYSRSVCNHCMQVGKMFFVKFPFWVSTCNCTLVPVFSLRFWCHSPIWASNFKINSPGQKFTSPDFPLQFFFITKMHKREVLSLGPGGGGGRCCHLVWGGGVVTWSPTSLPLPPPPPPGVEVTHACENITFARFTTRAVKMNQTIKMLLLNVTDQSQQVI